MPDGNTGRKDYTMKGVAEKIEELKALKKQLLELGGPDAVAKHTDKGKLTARQRLELLFRSGHLP
jgi:methylmalonyl-CoA decarboxylase subunit alpha